MKSSCIAGGQSEEKGSSGRVRLGGWSENWVPPVYVCAVRGVRGGPDKFDGPADPMVEDSPIS